MKAGKKKSRPSSTLKSIHRVVRDDSAKSKRKRLIGKVRHSLDELNQKYFSPIAPNDQFPSADELNQLRSSVVELYQDLGARRVNHRESSKMFVRVEKKYSTLRLGRFCERLLKKLEGLPLGPMTRMTKKVASLKETDEDSAEKLKAIVELLDQNTFPLSRSKPWHDYYLLLRPFVSDDFEERMMQRTAGDQDYEWAEKVIRFHQLLGWAAFIDIWEQAKAWHSTYDPLGRGEICRTWLEYLHIDEFDSRLWATARTDSDVLPMAKERNLSRKQKAKLRKRKSRATNQPKKPRQKA